MKKTIIFLVLGLFLYSCNTKPKLPTQDTIISKMNDMSNLGTIEYSLTKIVQVDDKQWYSIGPRKLLISCKAYVKAGIDFKNIRILEINDSLKSIKIEIPDAKILIVNIPPNEIEVINTHIGLLRANFTHIEMNDIQKQAEVDINNKIQDLNILYDAKKNGKLFLHNFLKSLGFQQIFIFESNYILSPITDYGTQVN
jgi:hypothetical protein